MHALNIMLAMGISAAAFGMPWHKIAFVLGVVTMILQVLEIPLVDTNSSHGGKCEVTVFGEKTDRVHYGACMTQGRRAHMEDYYVAFPECGLISAGEPLADSAFVGVYDGHGGAAAGDFLTKRLHENVRDSVDFNPALSHSKVHSKPGLQNVEDQLRKAFLQTDLEFLDLALKYRMRDGSTATTAMLLGDVLICANVGDSRTIMSHKGRAVALSTDHKPDLPAERCRIEAAGGHVRWSGCYRVEGDLAVSRAFGDKDLKKYVSAEPGIEVRKLKAGDESLILASDGLWDVMTNQEVVDIARRLSSQGTRAAAKGLVLEAYNRGSGDNVTVLVLDLAAWRAQRTSGGKEGPAKPKFEVAGTKSA